MDSIITTNIKEITLNSKFMILKTSKGELDIDIKQLLKEPLNSDSAYFNATQIAKFYNKNINEFMRNNSTKEFIAKLEEKLNMGNTTYLKLVKTVRGKYHGGTWFHKKLFLKFVSWIDIDFEIAMYDFIEKLIVHSNELKINRNNTKILFEPLTKTIKDIYIPKQESDNSKKYAYSTLSNLINIKVLGCSAKKYIEDNNLDKDIPLRDQLNKKQLEQIKKLEEDLNGYIKYANITNYEKLKNRIGK